MEMALRGCVFGLVEWCGGVVCMGVCRRESGREGVESMGKVERWSGSGAIGIERVVVYSIFCLNFLKNLNKFCEEFKESRKLEIEMEIWKCGNVEINMLKPQSGKASNDAHWMSDKFTK